MTLEPTGYSVICEQKACITTDLDTCQRVKENIIEQRFAFIGK